MDLPLAVDYSLDVAPAWYRCADCGKTNVKLWREYQPMGPFDLTCASCTEKREGKSGIVEIMQKDGSYISSSVGVPIDSIGWTTPAIPYSGSTESGLYHGRGSTPDEANTWWRNLPNS